MSDTRLASLETFLDGRPTIKYIPPSSPDYPSMREQWNIGRSDTPLAIVQPQSAADVSAVVKYAKSQNIDFTIRTGGHNIDGKAIVEGALAIDMRAIASVNIATDRQSATIGGGTLMQDVATKLRHEGLVTPIGRVPSVGYVGWAVYGGYGPFSAHWGLGVDQIIGATIINGDGKVMKADGKLLKGIRGAGGLFGAILDVTVKIYSLENVSHTTCLYFICA
jgi:FAD/FMN-containing dehydrogenase